MDRKQQEADPEEHGQMMLYSGCIKKHDEVHRLVEDRNITRTWRNMAHKRIND